MKQKTIDLIHFGARLFLVSGIFLLIINAGMNHAFLNGTVILISMLVFFLVSAILEINFSISSTFWIELSTRLVVFSSMWAVTLFCMIFLQRTDILTIIFIINSLYLFSLLREWKFST